MNRSEQTTWWILRPWPRGVRIAFWLVGLAAGASYVAFSFWPVTRRLLDGEAPGPSARELGVYLLGLALAALLGVIAAGAWLVVGIQSELSQLRREDSRP